MEVQTVKISNEKLIPSGASREGISVRRSGIAKVLWRKLNVKVPASKVIAGGFDIYKGESNGSLYSAISGKGRLYRYRVLCLCTN